MIDPSMYFIEERHYFNTYALILGTILVFFYYYKLFEIESQAAYVKLLGYQRRR